MSVSPKPLCVLLMLSLCVLQGESGPAGPSGAPGVRGVPVSVTVQLLCVQSRSQIQLFSYQNL